MSFAILIDRMERAIECIEAWSGHIRTDCAEKHVPEMAEP
jgi:hypothetical protein